MHSMTETVPLPRINMPEIGTLMKIQAGQGGVGLQRGLIARVHNGLRNSNNIDACARSICRRRRPGWRCALTHALRLQRKRNALRRRYKEGREETEARWGARSARNALRRSYEEGREETEAR